MIRTALCAHCGQETPLPDYFFVLWAGTPFRCQYCHRENVTAHTYEAAPGYALQARTYGLLWRLLRGGDKPKAPPGTLSVDAANRLLVLARECTGAGDLFSAILYRTQVINAPNLTKNPVLYSHRAEDYLVLQNAIDAERDYKLAIDAARNANSHNEPMPDDCGPQVIEQWQARLSAIEPLAAEQRAARSRRHWVVRWFFDFGSRYAYSEVQTYAACQSFAHFLSNVVFAGLLPVRAIFWIAGKDRTGLVNAPNRLLEAMTPRFFRCCVWGWHLLKIVVAVVALAIAANLLWG